MASNRTPPTSLVAALVRSPFRTKLGAALVIVALLLLSSRVRFSPFDPESLDKSQLTPADRPFLSQFNLYWNEIPAPDKPDREIATRWMNLVTLWSQSSRLLSFRDILKALPPPVDWPVLQEESVIKISGLTAQQQAIAGIAIALLNHDPTAEDRGFDDLLAHFEQSPHSSSGPAIIELFRLWDCLYGKRDDAQGASKLSRLLEMASRSGYSPTHPFEEIYIPNLTVLGSRAADFAHRILLLPTKLFLVTPNEETRRILRAATSREITQMSCLPSDCYAEEKYWGELCQITKLYVASHASPLMEQQFRLLFCAQLKNRNQQDQTAERLLVQFSVSSAVDDLVSQFLIYDLTGPAYQFTAARFRKTRSQWNAHRAGLFALMSDQDGDFERMAAQYPGRVALQDALIMMHLRRGKYEAALPELVANSAMLEQKTSFQLGIDELVRQALLLNEIDELLYGGARVGRPNWTELGLKRVRWEFDALTKKPSLSGQFRQVCFARILGTLIDVGQDDEAARDLHELEAKGAPLSLQVFPEKLRLDDRQKNWAEILALDHDSPDQFGFAQNEVLRSSIAGDIPSTVSAILAQARMASGQPAKALPYLTDELLAGRMSVPLLNMARSILGVPQTIALVEKSPAPEADRNLAKAFLGDAKAGVLLLDPVSLDPADLNRVDKMNLRAATFEQLAQTAESENDPASAAPFSTAARDWRQLAQAPLLYEENFYDQMIRGEEQAVSLTSKVPVLSFKLALELELAERKEEAARYYDQAFSPSASNQAVTPENQSSAWLESIPILSPLACAEIDRLGQKSQGSGTAFICCLTGLAARQRGESQQALQSFQTVLRLEPQNLVACQYVLELADQIPVPEALTQASMEALLAGGHSMRDPALEPFDLKKLWEATAGWSQSPPNVGSGGTLQTSRVPELDQALRNLAAQPSARRMAAIADTAALTSCANLMDALP